MRATCRLAVLLAVFLACFDARAAEPTSRFVAYELRIDSAKETLAAWQVELTNPSWRVVGIEGGEKPFDEPAYYDPKALQHDRIVLAAFTTASSLGSGDQRVAIVHVIESIGGDAPRNATETQLRVIAAANGVGTRIPVTARLLPLTEAP